MCLKSQGLFIEEEKEAKALELEENIREEASYILELYTLYNLTNLIFIRLEYTLIQRS